MAAALSVIGIVRVAGLLVLGAVVMFWALPDANAFNARVERIFIENDNLTSASEIKLLEILAQSGTAFSDTLTNYRVLIGVLLIFAAAMLVAAVVFLTAAYHIQPPHGPDRAHGHSSVIAADQS